jgi:hypothetical protein
MVRRALNVFVEELSEAIRKIRDSDLSTRIDPPVEPVTVIDQDLGYLDIEVSREVGAIREPAFRLLREAVDQHERRPPLVRVHEVRQVEPALYVRRHCYLTPRRLGQPIGIESVPIHPQLAKR